METLTLVRCGSSRNADWGAARYLTTLGRETPSLRGESMALVTCSECGREISDQAAACPGCGSPMSALPIAESATLPGEPGSQPNPGWYPDPSGEHASRFWDGAVWTDRTSDDQRKVSSERRKEALAQGLTTRLARPGQWRVESQTDYCAIVVGGKPTNHVLHLILTLVTFGFWGIVWIVMALAGGETRYKISVDEYGNGTTEKLG